MLGFLRVFDRDRLSDDDLNGLIRYVTNEHLHTTRGARQRLIESAGNLFILRRLLDQLAENIFGDERTWANYDDVVEVEKALKKKLREGEAEQLAVYVRDCLNDAESVNQWEPNPSLALAVSLASVREREGASGGMRSQAETQLRGWCEELRELSPVLRLTYDAGQFHEHFQALEERRVFRDTEFSSDLLESWLVGIRAERLAKNDAWQDMLMKAAVRRIRTPEPLERVDADGGQAKLWTCVSEGVKYAVRKTLLPTQEARSRFVEEKAVLDILIKVLGAGERGHEYVFRLDAVGLSSDDEWEAIQIYRWVEGADLSQRSGELASPFIADLGMKLSRALHLLHSSGILHRDIRPQNIVLAEQTSEPVIIDFGFARRIAEVGKTCLNDDWAAPEVRVEGPEWSAAADIYSLGRTLRSVLASHEKSTSLHGVLDRCVSSRPSERPSAVELEVLFRGVAAELHVDGKKEAIWKELWTLSTADRAQSAPFAEVLEKFRPKFEALALGCGSMQFDRCTQIASFLSHVLEAFGRKELVRGRVKVKGPKVPTDLDTPEIEFLHSLRTFDSHYLHRRQDALAKLGNPSETRIRDMTLKGAEQIAISIKIRSLPKIVEEFV